MEKYISKSALLAEIEKRRDAALTRQHNLNAIGQETVLNEMLANELNRIISFLDTLEVKEVQEEPVSEDLEEAAKRYSDNENPICTCEECLLKSFKAGAEWHKQQMKKDAIIATIESDLDPHGADYGNQKIICGYGELEAKRFKNGSKVKLIIIKED